ncbi:hypothetical protein DL93DRAFT_554355 [Clavulina sp. PMI_390]|nr:hypothetical protein DL93DRAFT_554355 [Clavulina sp. PMI_390]
MAMDLQDQEELPRATSPDAMSDASNALEAAEARELDQRMQARREQRSSSRASNHSLLSVVEETHDEHGSVAWKSRYGHGLALNPAASLHSITGSSRTRGLSIGSDISGRSSLVSGTDSVLEEDEDAETSDSPYSASRKDSGDLEGAGDETFVQLPPSNRPAPTILLAPIPTNPRKRGSLASLQSTSTRSLASSSGRSSPAFSRRSSELGPPPSARPEQTSFGAAAQFLPPPSSRPDQTSFSIHPPSSSSAQPVIGFPPLSARRRSIDAPSLGPPPVRSHTLSHSSRLRPLDPVPPSPIRGTEQESENDSRPPAPAPAPAAPKPEKKMKPKPLQIAVQPKSTTIEIERSSVDDLPKTASGHKHTLSSSSIGSVASSNSSRSASSSRASGSTSASGSKSRGGRLASLKTRAPQMNVVGSATPHQTLFIFPPSPQRFDTILSPDGHSSSYAIPATPSTMLLRMEPGGLPSSVVSSRASSRSASISSTSSIGSVADSLASVSTTSSRRRRVHALPSGVTPTIAAFRHRTFGTAVLPSTPTTATAHVEARGWVGSAGASTAGSGHAPAGAAELLSPLSPLTARAGARNSFGF